MSICPNLCQNKANQEIYVPGIPMDAKKPRLTDSLGFGPLGEPLNMIGRSCLSYTDSTEYAGC